MSSAKWRPFCLSLNVLRNGPSYLQRILITLFTTWSFLFPDCCCQWPASINSLAPGRSGCPFKTAIFTDHKSTLVQVMAWCRRATSHYLSQCWRSSMSPYGVTRPQWVKDTCPDLIYVNSITRMSQLICLPRLGWVLNIQVQSLWKSPVHG